MTAIRVLTESELRLAVKLGPSELDAIEAVYPLISAGQVSMPPIMRIDVAENHGEIDIKSAYLPGYAGIAVKVSAGFFDNPAKGLPSLGGLMMVFDSETGIPSGALFDNGYLTNLRTGLAGAVAAKHLSKADSTVAAILGAGVQAQFQLEALNLVRSIESARVWARRDEAAAEFVSEMTDRLDFPVTVADSPAVAVRQADIVVTTTPSTTPILTSSMISPGTHITAVGSDAETKNELDPDLLEASDVLVCDSVDQSVRLGEMRAAVGAGLQTSSAVELGNVIDGSVPHRNDSDITICDLTGTGAQDTAIASLAVQRANELGLGAMIET